MADELERFFEDRVDMDRLQKRLRRSRKAQELVDERVDPINFVSDQVRERLAKIGVLVTLRQKLGKGLDRNERILDFVRHTGGERAETREAVAATNLQLEPFQRRDIGENHERSQHFALLAVKDRAARAQSYAALIGKKSQFTILDPLAGVERLAQEFARVQPAIGRSSDRAPCLKQRL